MSVDKESEEFQKAVRQGVQEALKEAGVPEYMERQREEQLQRQQQQKLNAQLGLWVLAFVVFIVLVIACFGCEGLGMVFPFLQ